PRVRVWRAEYVFTPTHARSRWPSLVLFSLGLMLRALIYLCAIVTTSSLVAAAPSPAPSRPDINVEALRTLERQAWPFGRVGPADEDRLQDFALKRGFDLKAEMNRVYC